LAGDCGNYKGRIIGVNVGGAHSSISYQPSNSREGGIWAAAGPVSDGAGHLYFSNGNGSTVAGNRYDHTDSVLEINTSAKLLHSFAPAQWAADNAGDVDLGSISPALVGAKWVVQGGKSDRVYVLRQNKLGGVAGQVSVSHICASYGGAAVKGSTVYLPCTDGLRALSVDATGHLHVLWRAASNINGSPVVGGGRVWSLDAAGGVLYALSGGHAVSHVSVGATSHFATPALYGSLIVVPTMSGVTFVRVS
jgi:hypothetical protein